MIEGVLAEQKRSDYDGEGEEDGGKGEVAGGLSYSKGLLAKGEEVEVAHAHAAINYGASSENGKFVILKLLLIIYNKTHNLEQA